MTHRAVIAAVNNYSGQASLPPGWSVGNLNRSLDDAEAMNTLLSTTFGAQVTAELTDGNATREAILAAIKNMLDASSAGDVATFFFSGHGGRLPADGSNPQRYYECAVPASGTPITDLDLHALTDSLQPSYVNFTVILDSCNSGGIHEGTPDEPFKSATYDADVVKQCVDTMTTIVPCGAVVPQGDSGFDGNVSNVVGQGNGVVCSVDDNKALVASSKSCVVAACRYDESAWEAEKHSALTQAIVNVVGSSGTAISYLDLIDKLRDEVQNQLNKQQTPTLLGQQNRMNENFLAGWTQSKPDQFDAQPG
jgi:Caspase domain